MAPARKRSTQATSLPDEIAPMLAKSLVEPFDSPDHLFEIKWDGTRCIAFIEPDRIRLQNRRFVEMHSRYPELSALGGLPPGTAVDGEIIVLEDGKPSFAKLQQRDRLSDPGRIEMLSRRLPATFMVFDLLYLKGVPVMPEPLVERRAQLQKIIQQVSDPHLIVPDYIVDHGISYFDGVAKLGLEGVMAKRIDSPYVPGKRTADWTKIKVAKIDTFSVLGFVRKGAGSGLSSLMIGTRYRNRWMYKGNVGSGLTEDQRVALFEQLAKASDLEDPPGDGPKGSVWKATNLRLSRAILRKKP